MEGIVDNGPRDVQVRGMPGPKIEYASDGIVKVTSSRICGSECDTRATVSGAAIRTAEVKAHADEPEHADASKGRKGARGKQG